MMAQGVARRGVVLVGLGLLAGCGGGGRPVRRAGPVGGSGWSCVPYARARSGLPLQGDAWQWWDAAAGRYRRDRVPRAGSVLVFQRNSRLRLGHVSVVARIVSAREIRVDHANWGTGAERGREALDQPVEDVSAANDWSLVRVWYPPMGGFGVSQWPVLGFIHPEAA